jgi:hypothetical protein
MELGGGQPCRDRLVRFDGCSRHEQTLVRPHDVRRNLRNLAGRFPLSEHDFREALTGVAVMVDAREPQVLVRLLAQELKERLESCLRREVARTDPAEEVVELLTVHRAKRLEFVDLRPSWTVL